MASNRLTEEGLLFIEQTLRHLLPGISDSDFNKNYWKPSRQAIKRACDRSKASKNWLQLWPVLYAALITIPLLGMYLENSASYSDILWLMMVRLNTRWLGRWLHSALIQGRLKIPHYIRHTPWEVGSTSERHYSKRKQNCAELAGSVGKNG